MFVLIAFFDGFPAVGRRFDAVANFPQHARGQLPVDVVVFGHQHVQQRTFPGRILFGRPAVEVRLAGVACEGYLEMKGAGNTLLALRPHPALHRLHELAADGKTEAGPAVSPGDAGVRLQERDENSVEQFRLDADAGVRDAESQEDAVDGGQRSHRHGYGAFLGKFQGVGQQVQQHLLQALRVSHQDIRDLLRYLRAQGEPLIAAGQALHADHFPEAAPETEGDPFEFDHAGLDLAQIQDVVDDAEQAAHRTPDVAQELVLLFVQHRQMQHLRRSHDAVDRCPDFVAHVGQELALGQIGGLRLGSRFFQLRVGAQKIAGPLRHQGLEPVALQPERVFGPLDAQHRPDLGHQFGFLQRLGQKGIGSAAEPPRLALRTAAVRRDQNYRNVAQLRIGF